MGNNEAKYKNIYEISKAFFEGMFGFNEDSYFKQEYFIKENLDSIKNKLSEIRGKSRIQPAREYIPELIKLLNEEEKILLKYIFILLSCISKYPTNFDDYKHLLLDDDKKIFGEQIKGFLRGYGRDNVILSNLINYINLLLDKKDIITKDNLISEIESISIKSNKNILHLINPEKYPPYRIQELKEIIENIGGKVFNDDEKYNLYSEVKEAFLNSINENNKIEYGIENLQDFKNSNNIFDYNQNIRNLVRDKSKYIITLIDNGEEDELKNILGNGRFDYQKLDVEHKEKLIDTILLIIDTINDNNDKINYINVAYNISNNYRYKDILIKYYSVNLDSVEYKGSILKNIIDIFFKITELEKNKNPFETQKEINDNFNILNVYYEYIKLDFSRFDTEKNNYLNYLNKYEEYIKGNNNFENKLDFYLKKGNFHAFLLKKEILDKKDYKFIIEEAEKVVKIYKEGFQLFKISEDDLLKNQIPENHLYNQHYDYSLAFLYNLGIGYGYNVNPNDKNDKSSEKSADYLILALNFEKKLLENTYIDSNDKKKLNIDFGEEIKELFLYNKNLFQTYLDKQKQQAEEQKQQAEKQKQEAENDLEKHNLETEKLKLRSNNNLEYHLIKSALSKLGQDNIDGYFEPKLNEIVKEVKKDERIKNLKDDNDIIKEILKNNADYQIYKYFKDKSKGWFRLLVLDKIGFLKEYLEKKDYPFYNKAKQKASEDDLDYILPAIRVGYLGQWKDIISRNMDKFDKLKDQYLKHIGGSKREENRNLFKNEEIESIEKLYSKEMEFFKESNSNMEKIVTKFDIIMREKQDRDQKRKIFGKVMWFFSIESIVVLGGMGWYLFVIIHGGEQISTNNVILISIIISVTLSQITLMMYHIIKNLYILPNEQVEKMNIDKIFDITKILQDKIIDSSKK